LIKLFRAGTSAAQPEAAIARDVGRIGLLRDNPFQAHFAGFGVKLGTAPDLVIAVLQRRADAGEELL
jgi:hypothetical protein